MESRTPLRSILVALVGLGVIVLIFVLIVKGFSSGNGTGSTKNMIDIGASKYANGAATATLLIDEPTNVDQEHKQIRITVSGTQNEIDSIQGYNNTITDSHTYASNPAAFGAFLQALKLMNFAKGNSTDKTDYRGFCPTGQRYVYTFNDGTKDLFSYWSTSCGQGTFGGSRPAVRQLFENQVPDGDFDQISGGNSLSI